MKRRKLSFQEQALTLGYSSEGEMFKDLYLVQCFSIKEVAKIIGIAGWVVRDRLLDLDVPLRPRGGVNNLGNRKLVSVSSEELRTVSVGKLCIKYKVHPSTVFAERRIRGIRIRSKAGGVSPDLDKRQDSTTASGEDSGLSPEAGKQVCSGALQVRSTEEEQEVLHEVEDGE
jgi:hypothetical protein